MTWTIVNAHCPALFLGGFLFFLGFDRAKAAYSTLTDCRTPLLVGFFLAGLVLSSLKETPLFVGATMFRLF